jgi:hypothetical protein
MNEVILTSDELKDIYNWMRKFKDTDLVTISVDSSSGIGSITTASLTTHINGDEVVVSKEITGVDSW